MEHIEALTSRVYTCETKEEATDLSNELYRAAQEIRKLRLECPYAELHDHLLYWEEYADKMCDEASAIADEISGEEASARKYGTYEQQNIYRAV
jgi:hypothetical protein